MEERLINKITGVHIKKNRAQNEALRNSASDERLRWREMRWDGNS